MCYVGGEGRGRQCGIRSSAGESRAGVVHAHGNYIHIYVFIQLTEKSL